MNRISIALFAAVAISVAAGASAQETLVISPTSADGASQPMARPKRESISVVMDQALVVRAPDKIRTIILGNPSIADISSEGKGMLVITGKSYGSTNLVLIDEQGRVASETLIQVGPPRSGVLTVQKGDVKEAY